jgi:DNA-binding SARP family transcriptional activator
MRNTSQGSTQNGECHTELSVEFKILGPVEITAGSERLELGGTRQQIVLAMLLLSANRVVTMDRLLEAIYGEDPPPTARSQAQISISWLRRVFDSHGRNRIILTREHGYAINVDGAVLDSRRFEELVSSARTCREAGRLDQAIACYRDALRLWRGPALDGINSQLIRSSASRLDEHRMATNEDRLTLELELGRHHELIGELTELVQEHPLRERLRGQLMLALYRCDRAAEALEVYRQARQTMIDELGIEPGARLRQLQGAILNSDRSLDLPVVASTRAQPVQAAKLQVPSLLPTDIADFTGRTDEIRKINQHLIRPASKDAQTAVPVVVLVGKGGVGKTSIAVHASHSVAAHFPGGQLFADLHGGTSHLVSPTQVLERFLRALGVPGTQIPEGLDERAEVYRNLLADRKVLVAIDGATSESQVSPLLPGTGASAVIITSRNWLTGLAGAIHLEVGVFDQDKSLDLLAGIAGVERVKTQRSAAAAVADHCGHLPLALRIAGARLSARPHWSIQHLVDRLADETRRLDELRHGDMGIRPSILLTYDSVGEQARCLFRRLALLDVPAFTGGLGAALLDMPFAQAQDVLEELVSAQLIETLGRESDGHSQYRFHDLIRVFARERLAAEEPAAERRTALERALGALLYLAELAHCRYFGGDYVRIRSDALRWKVPERLAEQLVGDPLSWYERERAVLVAAVRQAAKAGLAELCWGLASSAVPLFESRVYLDDWRETHDIALEATSKARNVRGQAAIRYSIGSLHIVQQRFVPAHQELTTAAQLFAEVGDDQGIALVIRHIAYLDRLGGRLQEATRRYEQALALFRKTEDQIAIAYVLQGLAHVRLELNELDGAKDLLAEALRLCRGVNCGRIEAQVLHRMGEAHLKAGNLAEAVSAFEGVLKISYDIGDLIGEGYAWQGIGVARLRQGEFSAAHSAFQRVLELAESTGERLSEARSLLGLSELALAQDDPAEATVFAQEAGKVFGDMGILIYYVQALTLLSEAYSRLGEAEAANTASAEADALRAKLSGKQQPPISGGGLLSARPPARRLDRTVPVSTVIRDDDVGAGWRH